MIVVSDSSPLIALAKINSFFLLQKLFVRIVISKEVYEEVVVAGAGLAGATDTSTSSWVDVRRIKNPANLTIAQNKTGLGVGELSTMILAREIRADLILLDDLGARKLAQKQGFKVLGCIAILEASFRKGYLSDLRESYVQMLKHGVYLNRQLLNLSLKRLQLTSSLAILKALIYNDRQPRI